MTAAITAQHPSEDQPSLAYMSLRVAAAWALAPFRPDAVLNTATHGVRPINSRLQYWSELQMCICLECLGIEEAKQLQDDAAKPLKELLGLAARVLEVVLEDV